MPNQATQPSPSHSGEPTSFTSRSSVQLRYGNAVTGVVCRVVLILLFAIGSLVASEPYRQALAGAGAENVPLPRLAVIQYSLIVLTSYTVTNVAILCVLSSMLGGLYSGSTRGEDGENSGAVITIRLLPYLIQGFVIFLLLISGLFLLGEEPFANLTQNRYIRMAGTASLLSFAAGYKPRIFYKWLERFDEVTAQRKSGGK